MSPSINPKDAELSTLKGRTIAVIGYGNQGRAQALNLKESGCSVIIGNVPGQEALQAQRDGFDVSSIAQAASIGDIVVVLLPDEIQRSIYRDSIEPNLDAGQTLSFAHGYNIHYGYIRPQENIDVILVAPRMIGAAVRELYVSGDGTPVFVAVHQNASGMADSTAVALARGLGASQSQILWSSFEEETELDLFSEQAVWPIIWLALESAFELLTTRGYNPEAVLLELYRSGEPSRVLAKAAEEGLFRQLRFHSRTSQYGTLSRMERLGRDSVTAAMARALDEIRNGDFAREWEAEERQSFPRFSALMSDALAHPINEIEHRMAEAGR